jgi:quinoprotein glucose dehydrogenase
MRFRIRSASILVAVALSAAVAPAEPQAGSTSAPPAPGQRGAQNGEWPTYHGDLYATQYAPLDQINRDNVSKLAIAWRWESPDNPIVAADKKFQPWAYKSTPLMVGGRLYVNTSLGQVAAIDARTGETIWVFDTKSREAGRPTNLGWNSRGVGYWTDGTEERIFQPSGDAMLWAIDARTGKPIESFGDKGRVDVARNLRRLQFRGLVTLMSSPLVVSDVVIVGSSISDGPTRTQMPPGDVQAFDVRTGEKRWTFHNPPIEGEYGYGTWENGAAEYSGNANVWTNMSADPELGLVYLPFGTPTNDWYGGHRLGDDLFAESIVCVRAATGERVWHYQLIHHGLWDWDIPAAPHLFDATIDGKPVKGVAVLTKQGFVYVFDRVTGEPVWPIEERPVPQSDVPGERTSPTQPFPTKPPAFEYQGDIRDVLIDFTPEIRAEALEIVSHFKPGPMFTPPVVSTPEIGGTIQLPGWGGGANWWGASFDPDSGMLYLPSVTSPITVGLMQPDASRSDFKYVRGMNEGAMALEGPRGLPLTKPPYGRVTAIDLTRGEIAWQVPHGDGIRQQLIDMGIPDPGPVGSRSSTGPLLTKTLLFFGQGSRTSRVEDSRSKALFRALDKKTGAVVHEMELPAEPSGTPMTYLAGGKQYIAFAVGGGPEAGIVALALP